MQKQQSTRAKITRNERFLIDTADIQRIWDIGDPHQSDRSNGLYIWTLHFVELETLQFTIDKRDFSERVMLCEITYDMITTDAGTIIAQNVVVAFREATDDERVKCMSGSLRFAVESADDHDQCSNWLMCAKWHLSSRTRVHDAIIEVIPWDTH